MRHTISYCNFITLRCMSRILFFVNCVCLNILISKDENAAENCPSPDNVVQCVSLLNRVHLYIRMGYGINTRTKN